MKLEGYTEDETTLLVWADAYERCGFNLVTDALFDGLAYEAGRKRKTSRFEEHTGQWVADHRTPELVALTDDCVKLAKELMDELGHEIALVWPRDLPIAKEMWPQLKRFKRKGTTRRGPRKAPEKRPLTLAERFGSRKC